MVPAREALSCEDIITLHYYAGIFTAQLKESVSLFAFEELKNGGNYRIRTSSEDPKRYVPTEHAKRRMAQRNVSLDNIYFIFKNGIETV